MNWTSQDRLCRLEYFDHTGQSSRRRVISHHLSLQRPGSKVSSSYFEFVSRRAETRGLIPIGLIPRGSESPWKGPGAGPLGNTIHARSFLICRSTASNSRAYLSDSISALQAYGRGVHLDLGHQDLDVSTDTVIRNQPKLPLKAKSLPQMHIFL